MLRSTGSVGPKIGYRCKVPLLSSIIKARHPLLQTVCRRTYAGHRFSLNSPERKEARALKGMPKYKQWALFFGTNEFQRMMTKYYVGMFAVVLVALYFYMRDKYDEEKHLNRIRKKFREDKSSLSEYEFLKLKATSGIKLKPREEKKLQLYLDMRKDLTNKDLLESKVVYNPSIEELEKWFNEKNAKFAKVAGVQEDAPVQKNTLQDMLEKELNKDGYNNQTNPDIQQPVDTTELFDEIAEQYDDLVKWEERGILMGSKRKQLMKRAYGHVLEVACGTGRNIPYFELLGNIDSITYMDSSPKMVESCKKKFRERYPQYKKTAFAVGKAEDLDTLTPYRYDTIVEAFGLCAYEDPVKALKNMTKILKPGGRLVLLEHGRAKYDILNTHLDFRAEKRMKTWGCRWNLNIGELVEDAGLDITYEKRCHFGTTWLLVCKRPEDPLRLEEKPFIKKLLGSKVPTLERK